MVTNVSLEAVNFWWIGPWSICWNLMRQKQSGLDSLLGYAASPQRTDISSSQRLCARNIRWLMRSFWWVKRRPFVPHFFFSTNLQWFLLIRCHLSHFCVPVGWWGIFNGISTSSDRKTLLVNYGTTEGGGCYKSCDTIPTSRHPAFHYKFKYSWTGILSKNIWLILPAQRNVS